METPAGIIDDVLTYFNAYHAEENRRMTETSGSGGSDKLGVETSKGSNPNIDYNSKDSIFRVDSSRQRRTPPPMMGNLPQ